MDVSADLLANLTSPPVLAFFLGILAFFLHSDLRVPPQVHESVSLFLLLAIGIKGGIALSVAPLHEFVPALCATLTLGVFTPLLAYLFARYLGRLSRENAAAMAAHYGSVSAVTFMAGLAFLERSQEHPEAFMPALLAILEAPAILISLIVLRLGQRREESSTTLGGLIHEILSGKTLLLLFGGLIIGLAASPVDQGKIKPFFVDLFFGILTFFMLEMGLLAAARFKDLRRNALFLVLFSTLVPMCFSVIGAYLGYLAGLSTGGVTMLAIMAASASYIAAPAAVRLTIPQANPALYLTAALGLTLPFNLIFGIPLYLRMARSLTQHQPFSLALLGF
ncbi:MAG: sodium-dependent bicarbonate transport family permease [Rickettsiales bacterium]|nr:sodium-dependent bicarbonate transport family permease [Rickettsiales bacterium]